MTTENPAAIDLLRTIYKQRGPKGKGPKVLPPKVYARYSDAKVDEHFLSHPDRHLMREVAKVLANEGTWK
jgi:hypothetical protein